MADEKKENAVCGKCGKQMETARTENLNVYHATCLSLEEIIALTKNNSRKK